MVWLSEVGLYLHLFTMLIYQSIITSSFCLLLAQLMYTANMCIGNTTKLLYVFLKYHEMSWEPFRICLLHITANPANFHPNWAWLAVLFSRRILNGSQDFFLFNTLIFIYLSKYETIETHAHTFLSIIILATVESRVLMCVTNLGNQLFVKRSQSIRDENTLHKQSEIACMCF